MNKHQRILDKIAKEDRREIIAQIGGEPIPLKSPTELSKARFMFGLKDMDNMRMLLTKVQAVLPGDYTEDEVFNIIKETDVFDKDSKFMEAVDELWGFNKTAEDEKDAAELGEGGGADGNFSQPEN